MLMMAGSQAKQIKIKTPRGQAWPAETQSSEATSADPANRQRANGPAHRPEFNHRHRRTESGDQTVMTMIGMTRAGMSTSEKWQPRGRFRPTRGTSGMRMRRR